MAITNYFSFAELRLGLWNFLGNCYLERRIPFCVSRFCLVIFTSSIFSILHAEAYQEVYGSLWLPDYNAVQVASSAPYSGAGKRISIGNNYIGWYASVSVAQGPDHSQCNYNFTSSVVGLKTVWSFTPTGVSGYHYTLVNGSWTGFHNPTGASPGLIASSDALMSGFVGWINALLQQDYSLVPNQESMKAYLSGVSLPAVQTVNGTPVSVVGTPGAPGAPGAVGPAGPAGPQGATGAQGPAGQNGINGINGIDGVNGTNGGVGDKGDQGDKGDKGDNGDQGNQGEQGIEGDVTPEAQAAAAAAESSAQASASSAARAEAAAASIGGTDLGPDPGPGVGNEDKDPQLSRSSGLSDKISSGWSGLGVGNQSHTFDLNYNIFGQSHTYSFSSRPESGSALDSFRELVRSAFLVLISISFIYLLVKTIRYY